MRDLIKSLSFLQGYSQDDADYDPLIAKALSIYGIVISLLFLTTIANKILPIPTEAQTVKPSFPSLFLSFTPLPTQLPSATPIPTPEPTTIHDETFVEVNPADIDGLIAQRERIKEYIYRIFGKNGSVAVAIATAESGKVDQITKKAYFATYAVNRSAVEVSVGLFQVNLKSKETLVHWARVPGSTEEEKIGWLQDPYNNTLFAFWVFSTSNFFPWSTFSDGTYLKYLK